MCSDPVEVFEDFMLARGVRRCKIKTAHLEGTGWGFVAEECVRDGDVILRIPSTLIITASTALNTYLSPVFKKYLGLFSPFEALCLLMFCEKLRGPASSWREYLAVVPDSFDTPISFPDLSANALPASGRELLNRQRAELQLFRSKMERILPFLLDLEEVSEALEAAFDWSLVLWAWNLVNTRCVFFEEVEEPELDCSAGNTVAIVPYFDFFNHSFTTKLDTYYNKKLSCYEVRSTGTVMESEQVFVCYGPHSNARLLLEYGFMLPYNPNNVLYLSVEDLVRLGAECGWITCRKQEDVLNRVVSKCGIYESQEEPSWNLVVAVKILTMDAEQLNKWQQIFNWDQDQIHHETASALAKLLLKLHMHLEEESRASLTPENVPLELKSFISKLWNEEIHLVQQCLQQLEIYESSN